ncbi:hypothetical protein [Diaphorobacter sp.]|uniref:hypothetical protein n=1 Tax=Diaphorobacter sp. TaxID=1934310 RepID=UPI0028B10A8D|nr:hypothetical protein [Diaphorobacter sp.]
MSPAYITVPTDYVVPHGAAGIWLASDIQPVAIPQPIPAPVRLRNGQVLRSAYGEPPADLDHIVRSMGEW